MLRGSIRARGSHQREYLKQIRSSDLTFGIGPAGTGKTYLAVACAVEALQAERVRRIVLVRPAVEAGERLGFLPGDLTQKVDPYLRPMYDALYEMLGFDRVARFIERNVIEVAPLAFMRGRSLNDSFIILDEAQNTTIEQMKMFLTRIGFGSRAVVTGDVTQTDLPSGKHVGPAARAWTCCAACQGVAFTFFDARDVVRHPLVQRIVQAYESRGESHGTARGSSERTARREGAAARGDVRGVRAPGRRRARELARWAAAALGRARGADASSRSLLVGRRREPAAERALSRPRPSRPTCCRSRPAPLRSRAARRAAARGSGDLPAVLRAEARAQHKSAARALGAPRGARRAAPARLRP